MTVLYYFSSYADHMWRFYARHRNANLDVLTDVSRMNWIACDTVFNRLPDPDKTYIQLYYGTSWTDSNNTLRNWCLDHNVNLATAWNAIHYAQCMAASERGIIDHKDAARYLARFYNANDRRSQDNASQ